MLSDILKIAGLCILIGAVSIPVSFTINASPWIVWLGNGLGSLFSAVVVTYICERITGASFKRRISYTRVGRKIVTIFDQGNQNKEVIKARDFINKHGLKLFSLLCPIFPGVLISTVAVYMLQLDTRVYRRWMLAGVFFVSGAYVFGYWFLFVR